MASSETINGFVCKDCTDIDYAKKHIDPAHPKDGPYGINRPKDDKEKSPADPAVIFSGAVSGPTQLDAAGQARRDLQRPIQASGSHLDVTG